MPTSSCSHSPASFRIASKTSRADVARTAAILLLGVFLTACSDVTSTPSAHVPTTPMAPNFMIECTDPSGCPNTTDTHVSADITIHSAVTLSVTSPVYDEETGQNVTSFTDTAPNVHLHVDAGYTTTGAVKVGTQWTDGPDPSASYIPQMVSADLTGDSLTTFDSVGYALTFGTPNEMQATTPMAYVGTTANGDITAGILVDTYDTTTYGSSVSPPPGASGPLASRSAVGEIPLGSAITLAVRGGQYPTRFNGVPVSLRFVDPSHFVMTDAAERDIAELSAQNGGSAMTRHTRTFVRGAGKWVLAEDRVEMDASDGTHRTHHEQVTTWSHVRWYINAAMDALRHKARPTTDWIPLASTSASQRAAPQPTGARYALHASQPVATQQGDSRPFRGSPFVPRAMIECGDACLGGSYGTTTTAQPLGQDPGCFAGAASVAAPGAAMNVLYQHGLFSNAGEFCDLDPYMRTRFAIGNEIRYSLNSVDYYQNQSADLESRFNTDINTFHGPYVFVGHSNGGVVSRLAAQDFNGDPSKVAGVVSVGTPHNGTAASQITPVGMSIALGVASMAPFACDIVQNIICTQFFRLASTSVGGLVYAITPFLKSDNPVLTQMSPNNSFYRYVNTRSDNFPHAAVVGKSWDRWIEWKVLGDWNSCYNNPGPNCGESGHTWANNADRVYHWGVKCAVVSGLLGIVLPGSRRAAAVCAQFSAGMVGVDLIYRHLVLAGDHGDGLVREASQKWPSASSALLYNVDDSDSHMAEPHATRAAQAGKRIADAIHEQSFVPFAQ